MVLAVALAIQGAHASNRLRTLLPDGAKIWVERVEGAQRVSMQLFASSRTVPETVGNHGWRHLLEHLVAVGKDGRLDAKLESRGDYLIAETLRDATRIELNLKPADVDLGFQTLADLAGQFQIDQATIDRELPIVAQEIAVEPTSVRLDAAAWLQAFGDAGLDPMGDLEAMRAATPDGLRALHRKLFQPGNLTLVVVGPIDVDEMTAAAKAMLDKNLLPPTQAETDRPPVQSGRVVVDSTGEARGAQIGPCASVEAMATVAAGLAIASDLRDAYFSYDPSARSGLAIVGKADELGVARYLDAMTDSDVDALYSRGKALARRWIQRDFAGPSTIAASRGELLSENADYRPEALLEWANKVRLGDFRAAVAKFRGPASVEIVGGKS